MARKIHPNGFRLGVIRDWTAKWYAGSKHYSDNLASDIKLREHLKKKLAHAALSKIVIERPAQNISITLYTPRHEARGAERHASRRPGRESDGPRPLERR